MKRVKAVVLDRNDGRVRLLWVFADDPKTWAIVDLPAKHVSASNGRVQVEPFIIRDVERNNLRYKAGITVVDGVPLRKYGNDQTGYYDEKLRRILPG